MKIESNVSGDDESGFLASNAEFFAQAFASLNGVLNSSGAMSIISEEAEMTVVVGVREPDADDSMDVDCVLFEANQASLQACMETLFSEQVG